MKLIGVLKKLMLEQDISSQKYDVKWHNWSCKKISDSEAEKMFQELGQSLDMEASTDNDHVVWPLNDIIGRDSKTYMFDEFINTWGKELENNTVSIAVFIIGNKPKEYRLIRKNKQWFVCDYGKDSIDSVLGLIREGKQKPSAGLSKEKKSAVVKAAKSGKDIGKKGKGFEALAKKAGGGEKGKKIAAAAMWKNIKREGVNESEHEDEPEDHEVSMAMNSLKSIINSAYMLMEKLGSEERNIPGWIQDHITNAENYIDQAAQGFHEIEGEKEDEDDEDIQYMTEKKLTGAEKRKKEDVVKALAKEKGGKEKLKPRDYAIATSQAIKSA